MKCGGSPDSLSVRHLCEAAEVNHMVGQDPRDGQDRGATANCV